MEFKITVSNIKLNFLLYKIYFLATTIILSIFSSFLNFTSDKIILEKISESGRVESMAKSIYVFLLLLIVFFMIYFNHFFLKNRSRETGILALLGFPKFKLIKILSYESLIILLFSYIVSLFIGFSLYLIIKYIIINILNLKIYSQICFDLSVAIRLLVITIIIFIFNTIINTILVNKLSLIQFVNYSKRNEKNIKVRPILSFVAFIMIIIGYLICLMSFWKNKGIWGLGYAAVFSLTIFLISMGTVILIRFGLTYSLNAIRKNESKLYTPIGNILYPKLIFRIFSKSKLLIVLSLTITLTSTIIGIMIFTLVYPIKAIERLNPSAIEYVTEKSNISKNKLENILNQNNANILETKILRINTIPGIPLTEKGDKKIDFFDVIKFEDYKKIMINQNRNNKIEKLENKEYLLINYYPTKKPLYIQFTLSNNDKIKIKKLSTNNIFSFANSVTTLVVDDNYYKKLENENIGKEIRLTVINGKNLRNNRLFYENFKNIEGIQSSYFKRYIILRDNSSTFIFISFIAVLLVICTASILYFTNLIEILENKKEYSYLSKIGYSKKQILEVLKNEIMILFKIPLIIGITNGSFVLFAIRQILIDNLISSKELFIVTIIALSIFIGIYFIFYLITKKAVAKLVKLQ